jgi:hypothetical protein
MVRTVLQTTEVSSLRICASRVIIAMRKVELVAETPGESGHG